MRFLNMLLPLALLASPIFATPVDLDARAGETVRCRATDVTNSKKHKAKTWTVSVDDAKEIIKEAKLAKGPSGYPHGFRNTDGIEWDPPTCKKTNIDLVEYPVFWQGHKKLEFGTKMDKQAHSPIRVVYANSGGAPVYCGIMIHSEVTKEDDVNKQESWRGDKKFEKCT